MYVYTAKSQQTSMDILMRKPGLNASVDGQNETPLSDIDLGIARYVLGTVDGFGIKGIKWETSSEFNKDDSCNLHSI